MSVYVDTSALLKLYIAESESDECRRILRADPVWVTARHTWVETKRNLARLLSAPERRRQDRLFAADWSSMAVVELDQETCERAADLAVAHDVRTLDSLHLAAAVRAGAAALSFLTYDVRQAVAARSLGLSVVGA